MRHDQDSDARLLWLLQAEFPLTARPFDAMGRRLGMSGRQVIQRVKALKRSGVIRHIGGMFDARLLGYQSALVAMKCPRERLDRVAAVVSKHPGVTHNYARTHSFNLWFTISVPPGGDLQTEVETLRRRARPLQTIVLPSARQFKLRLVLPVEGRAHAGAPRRARPRACRGAARHNPAAVDAAVVRELQADLHPTERPFLAAARRLGVTEQTLLRRARTLMRAGVMRRFGAVLHHRRAGFTANCMAVWSVPKERIGRAGKIAAAFESVSHCYERPRAPGWPYTLFAMIHGRSKAECRRIANEISARIGNPKRALLFTTKEYKKTRPVYFSGC